MNKKGQIMEFAFFSIAILISIAMVIIIIELNLPDVTLVGQTPVRVMATQDLAENAKVFTDIVFEQRLPIAKLELINKRGFNDQIFEGMLVKDSTCDYLNIPVITEDCFPDYKNTYSALLSASISNQIQRYDPVNLERNTVRVNITDEFEITTYFDEDIRIPFYSDTSAYYGVIHRPGASSNQIYARTQEGYLRRTGLNSGSRGDTTIDSIVVHWTVTRTADDSYTVLDIQGFSYHYVIDKDGSIHHYIEEDRAAFHAGCPSDSSPDLCTRGYNQRSIGISLVNMGHDAPNYDLECEDAQHYLSTRNKCFEVYTEEQIESTIKLIQDILDRHPTIPVDRNHIVGHDEIDRTGRKLDPGPLFPWDYIMSNLRDTRPLV